MTRYLSLFFDVHKIAQTSALALGCFNRCLAPSPWRSICLGVKCLSLPDRRSEFNLPRFWMLYPIRLMTLTFFSVS